MNSAKRQKIGVLFRKWKDRSIIEIFDKEKKYFNHLCPDSAYSNTLLLIIYSSYTETLICRREMGLIGSTSLGFAQNTMIFKKAY